jgi:hypothetical protein
MNLASTRGSHRRISRRTHGLIDYIFGVLLIAMPWVLPIGNERLASEIMMTLGLITIVMSIVTHYELGLVPLLPFQGHLFFDAFLGVGLLFAPWHFNVGGLAGLVMCVFGVSAIIVNALTERPGRTQNAT